MMMEKLHSASHGLVWKIILAFVAVSFVLSGAAGYMLYNQDTSVAKVNGEKISQNTFQRQYQIEYQRLSEEFGNQFIALADSPNFTRNLRNQVLETLINDELLKQYTESLSINVSDDAVKKHIVQSPEFQTEGKFDNQRYQSLLASNNLSTDYYGALVAEGLKQAQLKQGIWGSDFVLPSQQEHLAQLMFQQRYVRLATLPISQAIAKQSVTDEEVNQYYTQNKAAFATPEMVKVQYLDLSKTNLAQGLKVSDVEIAQYYQDNKAQFVSKPKTHIAIIQVAQLQEAKTLLEQLEKGADFGELAKEHSLDKPTAHKGGDLNWVTAGEFPPIFDQAVEALEVGQVSQPVLLDKQYYLIKVLDRKQPIELPLEQVKQEIADRVREDLANNAFYRIEKQVAEKAFENANSLEMAAQVAGMPIKETAFFPRTDIPQSLNYPNLVSAIFDTELLQGGMNSEPISVDDQHSIVVRVVAHQAEGTIPFDEAKPRIVDWLKAEKAKKWLMTQAKETILKLEQSQTLEGTELPENVQFAPTQILVWAEPHDPMLTQAVFSMAKPKDDRIQFGVSENGHGDIVIIALQKIEQGKLNMKQAEQFGQNLQYSQFVQLQNAFMKALRDQAKIEINTEFMQQNEE